MKISGKVLRYIFSGLIASLAMLVSLVFFREVLGIWYLYASTMSFIIGFTTSFILQKIWTFKNRSKSNVHKQFALFLIVSLINLGINGLGMFVLVDIVGVWYFFSQILVTTFIAVSSFLIYQAIFQGKTKPENGNA